VVTEPEPQPAIEAPETPEAPVTATEKPRGRRGHAAVPSWEDVLLGVRSQRG